MDAQQQQSRAASAPAGTGLAGPGAEDHSGGGQQAWPGAPVDAPKVADATVVDAPADQFESSGRASFLRGMQGAVGRGELCRPAGGAGVVVRLGL